MDFHDFQIRAWTEDRKHAAVIVHSSPAGSMSRPVSVPLDWEPLNAFRDLFRSSPRSSQREVDEALVAGGRALASVLFTDQVRDLFIRSQERVGPSDGLRVRLCFDDDLSDLPWEYLNIADSRSSPQGFLALNSRISLVRESPQPGRPVPTLRRKKRLLFFFTRWCNTDGADQWEAAKERDRFLEALKPANAMLQLQSVLSQETNCEMALQRSERPTDIFHYSGHTDVERGAAYLAAGDVDAAGKQFDRLYAGTLGPMLGSAGITLAVFSACNSGSRVFVDPILQAGVPVVIGAQGAVYVDVAVAFCERLYSALATGLSLDEAVTWGRLHLLEPDVMSENLRWQWGSFIVYMQAADAVLFPRPKGADVAQEQEAARRARQVTIINVTQNIGSVQGGTVTGAVGSP